MKEYKMWIGGEWVGAESGETFETRNPANGEVTGIVPKGNEVDVNKAVAAAKRAFQDELWGKTVGKDRSKIMLEIARLLRERVDEIATIETLDNGMVIKQSRQGIPTSADCLEYFAGISRHLLGETIPGAHNVLDFTIREPIGVVGLILPWNFPLGSSIVRLAPVLAAGNTVVIKPSGLTPLSILALGKIMEDAGLPPGVVNIVTGPGDAVGMALARHPDVGKIGFTGSNRTGRMIMEYAAGNIKGVGLELGGKNANIVFPDADLGVAIRKSLWGAFFNQGQNCLAASRLFLHEKIHDEFVEKLVGLAQGIKVGPGMEPDSQMGPLISPEHRAVVEGYIQAGLEEGAKLVLGGKRPEGELYAKGNFILPTIFDKVDTSMRIAREEIFGPVLCVFTFSDVEEVIEKANDTPYGLAAAVWTKDISKAFNIAKRLQVGNVWINTYGDLFYEAPHGGYKQSGIGRDHSMHSLLEYTEIKNVIVSLAQ